MILIRKSILAVCRIGRGNTHTGFRYAAIDKLTLQNQSIELPIFHGKPEEIVPELGNVNCHPQYGYSQEGRMQVHVQELWSPMME
jgi:hypothetical protein